MSVKGVRVTVQGDIPAEALTRLQDAVRETVLHELAALDLSSSLSEVPLVTQIEQVIESAKADDDPESSFGTLLSGLGLLGLPGSIPGGPGSGVIVGGAAFVPATDIAGIDLPGAELGSGASAVSVPDGGTDG
jgi:hypothetical protein